MEMSPEEVEQKILGHQCDYLVITGGEPMIQQRELIYLLQCLKNQESYIEMETNATILPDPEVVKLIDHWSLSPKLGNSGNPPSLREVAECYRFFRNLPSSHFKYVIQDEDDLAEVQSIVQKYNLPAERIILMPQARDKETLVKRSRWLAEACKNQGYLFSTRLQIMLWGNQRGI
jgi:organic radical activating enzyme